MYAFYPAHHPLRAHIVEKKQSRIHGTSPQRGMGRDRPRLPLRQFPAGRTKRGLLATAPACCEARKVDHGTHSRGGGRYGTHTQGRCSKGPQGTARTSTILRYPTVLLRSARELDYVLTASSRPSTVLGNKKLPADTHSLLHRLPRFRTTPVGSLSEPVHRHYWHVPPIPSSP